MFLYHIFDTLYRLLVMAINACRLPVLKKWKKGDLMKRRLPFCLLVSFILLIAGCKLMIISLMAPENAETGTVIKLTISGMAIDNGNDGADDYGLVLQLPDGWLVADAKAIFMNWVTYILVDAPEIASLYSAEPGHYIWAGKVRNYSSSGNSNLTATIKILTGSFDGEYGTSRNDAVKVAVGVRRNGTWYADDPENVMDFSNITDSKYKRDIQVIKVQDTTAPDPVTTLSATVLGINEIQVDWADYSEEYQKDVIVYRIYRSNTPFSNVTDMTPISQLSLGNFSYTDTNVGPGNTYFYAVTAIDENHFENKEVTPVSVSISVPGTIRGVVYSSGSPVTEPTRNVSIQAHKYQCSLLQAGENFQMDYASGEYTLTVLPGDYYLTGNGQGFITTWWESNGGVAECTNAVPVTVEEGKNVDGVNFSLIPEATISGTVFGSDGLTPITGQNIIIIAYQGDPCDPALYISNSADIDITNATYTITGLPPGSYYLKPLIFFSNHVEEWWASPDSTPECNAAQAITVTAGQNVTDINFQLDPGATISGTVFGSDGVTPITGQDNNVYLVKGDPCDNLVFYSHSVSDANGTYTINQLAAGAYYLMTDTRDNYVDEWWASPFGTWKCSGAQGITVTVGQTVTDINFQLDPGATISGTVFGSDGVTPVKSSFIYVNSYYGDPCGSTQHISICSVSNTNGTYTINKLPEGNIYLAAHGDWYTYFLEWYAEPYSTMECSGAQAITVPAAQSVTGKNFQLDSTSSKQGDVNGDDLLDLKDLILILRVVSEEQGLSVNIHADVNGDNKIGIAEAIYVMKKVAGL